MSIYQGGQDFKLGFGLGSRYLRPRVWMDSHDFSLRLDAIANTQDCDFGAGINEFWLGW